MAVIMYVTKRNYENYGTWFQYATAVYGERDLRRGVQLLRELQGPLTPNEALALVSEWMSIFGPAGPEVSKIATYFFRLGLEYPEVEWRFIAPHYFEVQRLRVALMEFILNGMCS
ncbi:uncharacterized protein LOC123271288 [Cotesia glomerata]|uniref:uncharacterized protein LOC123271288 n=1 Tax=Cotesia glomerata TaxID=32391 RepID=UPI001D031513|nr:uncharacterized protein LOC123271288 [Cotesia glomerata]